MSDTNHAAEPVQAPGGFGSDQTFEDNMAEFLGYDSATAPLGQAEPVVEPATAPAAQPEPAAAEPAPVPAPVEPAAPAAPAPAPSPSSSPASPSNAAPAADPNAAPAPAQGPSDLEVAALLGLGQVAPAAQPLAAPAAQPAPSAEPAPPAEFRPFGPSFAIPEQVLTAIFDSDNRQTQATALSGLLSAVANNATAMAVKHVQENLAPQFEQQIFSRQAQQQNVSAVQNFFSTEFPDLNNYAPIVLRSLEVIAQQDPRAPITPELLRKAGTLAREGVKRLGFSQAQPAAAPAQAQVKPQTSAPLYVAGGARPGNTGQPEDPNSPAAVFGEMVGWN